MKYFEFKDYNKFVKVITLQNDLQGFFPIFEYIINLIQHSKSSNYNDYIWSLKRISLQNDIKFKSQNT